MSLAFVSHLENPTYTFDIACLDLKAGEAWRFGDGGYSPSWSPDGTRIVYERSGDLFILSVAGGARGKPDLSAVLGLGDGQV